MSNLLKINVTMISALLALACTLGGAVWAIAVRDSDLEHIENRVLAAEHRIDADHEAIADIRGDLKAMRAALERIEKKLP